MDIVTDGPEILLAGDFDVRCTWQVRMALYDALERHPRVVVDLGEVATVDVTALKVLAVASRFAARRGGQVRLRGCNGAVRRLLHMTHLIRLVDVERDALV
ncbi:STAS domain-containing protein [Nocardioides sp.]|uniref:STAS domain-containing protein n=1 Tax=Nocardioides sp. TaxID=35761 RepID=UPI002B27B920|nr:STAS domain-containing protein [Nocardioides sp.]